MRCSNCGKELSNNTMFCDNCGQEMQTRNKEIAETFCANCGEVIEQGVEFCGKCGMRVEGFSKANTSYIFCGNCGAKMPSGSLICDNCGKEIYTKSTFNRKNSFKKRYGIVIAVLLLIIMALIAVIVRYTYYNNRTDNHTGKTNFQKSNSTMTIDKPTNTPLQSALPTSTPNQLNDNSTHINSNIGKMETYYVVNCNQSISLREFPNTSAKVIKEIPLGDPVSYAEASQNGFAKIIYNGIEGYALQSYLSNNPEDIKKPDYNKSFHEDEKNEHTPSPNKTTSGNNSGDDGVISHPSYNTYTDQDYNFSCWYPTRFQLYNENDNFIRYSLKAPDNTATFKICGTSNSANLSVKTVLDNFKTSYPGETDYENSGSDWCVCRTYKDGTYHYGYFKIKDGMIRGFEFHFDSNYYTIYDKYINEIYGSLKFN